MQALQHEPPEVQQIVEAALLEIDAEVRPERQQEVAAEVNGTSMAADTAGNRAAEAAAAPVCDSSLSAENTNSQGFLPLPVAFRQVYGSGMPKHSTPAAGSCYLQQHQTEQLILTSAHSNNISWSSYAAPFESHLPHGICRTRKAVQL